MPQLLMSAGCSTWGLRDVMMFPLYGGVTVGNDAVMLVSQDCWEDSVAKSVRLLLGAAARCAEHRQSFENAPLSHSS